MEALIQTKVDVTDVGRGFFYVSEKKNINIMMD